MKAVRIHEYGDLSVLRYEDALTPTLRENDVLVRIHSAAVNPVDWQTRMGNRPEAEYQLPLIVGWDFAGTIESVGQATTTLAEGDRVYARPDITRDGTYAEYIAVDAGEIAKVPESVPLEVAASIPLCSLTAWRALFDHAGLAKSQTVLIHAAAGGVGILPFSWLVWLARMWSLRHPVMDSTWLCRLALTNLSITPQRISHPRQVRRGGAGFGWRRYPPPVIRG